MLLSLGGTPAHLFSIRPSKRSVLSRMCDGTGIVVSVVEAFTSALDQTNALASIFNDSAYEKYFCVSVPSGIISK